MIIMLARLPPFIQNRRAGERGITMRDNPHWFTSGMHIGVRKLSHCHDLFILSGLWLDDAVP